MDSNSVRISVIGGLLTGYFSILATGILVPLNRYIILGVTLPQLIFIGIAGILIGLIGKGLFFGGRSLRDTLADTTQAIQTLSNNNMTAEQAQEYEKQMTEKIGEKAYSEVKKSLTKKVSLLRTKESTLMQGIPSPEKLYQQLMHKYAIASFLPVSIKPVTITNQEIIPLSPQSESGKELQSQKVYNRRSFTILGIFIVISIGIYLIINYGGFK
jgi:hypothetical protein